LKKFRIVACIECIIDAESEAKAHEVFQKLDLGALDGEVRLQTIRGKGLVSWDLRDTEPMQTQTVKGEWE